jgi:23S rRNA (pseudouridine1915-N3)-methyltransferase
MEILVLCTSKTDDAEIKTLCVRYEKRISYYVRFKLEEIQTPKIFEPAKLTEKEGILILERVLPSDLVILLDEKGKEMNSVQFSEQLQKYMNAGHKRLVFIIGGPFGFSPAVRRRADGALSLSRMTFTHQMVRLFFTEQIYRAFTILRNEPYHHRD